MQQAEENEFRAAIKATHGCDSRHVESVLVHEIFRGETAWEGIVEIFDLTGHLKAKRCYAWRYREGEEWFYVAVLEIPPVDSAETAVKIAIAAKARTP
jgi:hypothetical protein